MALLVNPLACSRSDLRQYRADAFHLTHAREQHLPVLRGYIHLFSALSLFNTYSHISWGGSKPFLNLIGLFCYVALASEQSHHLSLLLCIQFVIAV